MILKWTILLDEYLYLTRLLKYTFDANTYVFSSSNTILTIEQSKEGIVLAECLCQCGSKLK